MAPALPDVPGVTHRDVSVRGVRLHVAQAGSGPPLLLLHGWPQHWWSWRHLIGPLAEHYTVIAPDLRGWGWSDAPPGDYAKATFADDILGLLDHEGLERVRIIAPRLGWLHGLPARARASRADRAHGRARHRAALARAPAPRQLALPVFLSYQFLLASPLGVPLMTRRPGLVRRIIRLGSGPDMRWSAEELDVYAEVLREPARARASSACYRTFLDPRGRARRLPGRAARRCRRC